MKPDALANLRHHQATAENRLDQAHDAEPDHAQYLVAVAQVHASLAVSYAIEIGSRAR